MWIIATLIASLAQTARNALQKELVREVGTIAATHARFLYGFPFACLFYGLITLSGVKFTTHLTDKFFIWGLVGAISQIIATALMLSAMQQRSFVVTTALIKTEPVLVAIFGIIFLGDYLSMQGYLAIAIATLGVVLISWKSGAMGDLGLKPVLQGLIAAGFFAISAIGFRGGINSLNGVFFANATTMLVYSLGIQAFLLTLYLLIFDRVNLILLMKTWRKSLFAGFTGALGSQFWFIAFSLESAAKVRTLALVEILMAQLVSGTLFKAKTSRFEVAGLIFIVLGVGLLLMGG